MSTEQQIEWIPISKIAKEYSKHPATLKRWAATGFLIHLGFRVKRDVKGQWLVARNDPVQSE